MNFQSCVCVDIMGPKFKLIFVWPNLAMQLKEYCEWTRRRNKVIAFPWWKHIFSCLKSFSTLFWSVWGAHSLSTAFPQRDRGAYGILCFCVCFCVYLCCFETAIVSGLRIGIHTVCPYAPVWVEDGWVCAYMHLFVAVYCLFYFLYYLVGDTAQCRSCEVSQ